MLSRLWTCGTKWAPICTTRGRSAVGRAVQLFSVKRAISKYYSSLVYIASDANHLLSNRTTNEWILPKFYQTTTQVFELTKDLVGCQYVVGQHVGHRNLNRRNRMTPHHRSMSKFAASLVDGVPTGLQPYFKLMRLDKPIGMWLLFWPCGWSIGLAAEAGYWPDMYMLSLFLCGALVMRGAGCVINDMWDRDLDSKVERTCNRPLASKQVSMTDAWIFLAGLMSVGALILMQLNWNCVMLGVSSLGLIAAYPLTKRVFNWPQLFLGMVFNWGALMGWSAVHGICNFAVCMPLYLAGISWTLVYDTIYAHQDKKDDIKAGIKSTALTFGKKSKYYLYTFSGTMATGLTVAGIMSEQTYPYFLAIGATYSVLMYQISTLKFDDPKDCGDKFVANSKLGFLIMLGILASSWVKYISRRETEEGKLSISTVTPLGNTSSEQA